MVLEKTLESPLASKEIKPVNPKGNQPLIFIGRTDAEAETPILWPPDAKNWLIWKDPDAGKDWRWEEMVKTEDETVGWHHWLSGHRFEQVLGDGEGQGSLVCCSLWGSQKVGHNWTTEQWQRFVYFLLWNARSSLYIASFLDMWLANNLAFSFLQWSRNNKLFRL